MFIYYIYFVVDRYDTQQGTFDCHDHLVFQVEMYVFEAVFGMAYQKLIVRNTFQQIQSFVQRKLNDILRGFYTLSFSSIRIINSQFVQTKLD